MLLFILFLHVCMVYVYATISTQQLKGIKLLNCAATFSTSQNLHKKWKTCNVRHKEQIMMKLVIIKTIYLWWIVERWYMEYIMKLFFLQVVTFCSSFHVCFWWYSYKICKQAVITSNSIRIRWWPIAWRSPSEH